MHSDIESGDLDCCKVIWYSNDRKTLRLHSDNEHWISQDHPIATFSLGATRRIEFVPHGAAHTRVVRSTDAERNSLYIMHSGCQSVLRHRVLPGNTADCNEHIKFSLSFRKCKPELDSCNEGTHSIPASVNSSSTISDSSKCERTQATLLLEDSFLARLDAAKLGKSKKCVLNKAKGGNKISDVLLNIDEFYYDDNNLKGVVH